MHATFWLAQRKGLSIQTIPFNTMRNLIVAYKNLPIQVRSAIKERYPEGYDDETFEFEIPGKNLIYKALRISIEGVNYLIKLDARYKDTDFLLDEDW
jgi:hypothetical protein